MFPLTSQTSSRWSDRSAASRRYSGRLSTKKQGAGLGRRRRRAERKKRKSPALRLSLFVHFFQSGRRGATKRNRFHGAVHIATPCAIFRTKIRRHHVRCSCWIWNVFEHGCRCRESVQRDRKSTRLNS